MIRRKIAVAAALAGLCGTLMSCGSGGGGSAPPVGPPAGPTLSLSASSSTTTDEGAGPFGVLVSGATAASGNIAWSFAPAVGTLDVTSNIQATYTPPPVDAITADTLVVITATPAVGTAGSLPVTVRLVPFQEVSATPALTTQVAPTVAPSIAFNRAVAGASVTATSIDLRNAGGSVQAVRSVAGRTVTMTPAQNLAWGTHYTVMANTSLRSLVGQALITTFMLEFDTIPPVWAAPRNVGPSQHTSGLPVVGFDAAGNALAVWMRDTDGAGLWNLDYARFSATTRSWSGALPLRASIVAMNEPQLALLQNGNALVVWHQTTSGITSIVSSRFDSTAGGWDTPVPIYSGGDTVGGVKLAMNTAGVAMVVWQRQSLPTAVVASRYAAATNTWAAPVSPQSSAAGGQNPHVAIDATSNAVTAWQESGGIRASRFDASGGAWGSPQILQTGTGFGGPPRVVVDATGNATVVYAQDQTSGPPLLMAAHYDVAGGGWSAARDVMASNGIPELAIDKAGNVMAISTFGHGGNIYSVEAARYDATTRTWTPTIPLETISPASFSNPYKGLAYIAIDGGGNAVAAWSRDPGTGAYNIFVARHSPATGSSGSWTTPVLVQASSANTSEIAVAADRFGNAIVIWGEDTGGVFNSIAARLSGD